MTRLLAAILLTTLLSGCAGAQGIKQSSRHVHPAPKWAESVGQSLYYAERTGKLPGVVLIMEHENDERYATRLDTLARRYNIKVWRVAP